MEANNYISDPELITYINNSLAELDDIMVTDYEDYKLSTFLTTLSPGANIIPLPKELYKLRGIDYQTSQGTNNWVTLFPFQLTERNKASSPANRSGLSYRVGGASVVIMPEANAAGTYQVWYTPKFVPLSDECDHLLTQMDAQAWVEYAVVDCCIKILNKQNMDPSGFFNEKQLLTTRIKNAAKNRDSSGPKHIANTRFSNNSLDLDAFSLIDFDY